MRKPYFILYIILLIFLTACGSNQHVSSDTGSISFKLQLSRPTTTSRAAAATSADICTDYGIMTINANVANSSGAEVAAKDWPCSAHQGTIEDVPAGADYTIRITGTTTGGTTAWRGEKSGVGVTAGEATPAGAITMTYTGNDITPPVITSTAPLLDATSVPVTTMITATFSEKMAASSINTTNFTVKEGATPVSGSVVYGAGTLRSIFLPSGNLSYSTTYTATLTTDIEDMAGNKMESVYSWSFTTGDPPSPDTLPDAPAGLIAASGNSQITINWDAVLAATSYNIYWSATTGVTKITGTKIPDITSTSYTHIGLTNGTIYYYMVTSVNSYGESVESYEISSAPGSIDGNPPTGSVTINNNAIYTTSTAVTLSLSSSSTRGISQMCISNTTTCSSWEPYTTSKSWPLTTGDGLRFVYAWFKDSAGISNTSPYLTAITLDTTPLTDGTLTATAGDGQVSLSWSGFSDVTSGIGSYKLVYSTTSAPTSCGDDTEIYSGPNTSYTHTGLTNGTSYYYITCAVDNAGNVSAGTSNSTIFPWTTKTPMTTARQLLTASSLNGKIFAIGGVISGTGTVLSVVEEYDPISDSWTLRTPMPTARYRSGSEVVNGKIYVIGGSGEPNGGCCDTIEEYDPFTDSWITKNSKIPNARGSSFTTAMVNGKIYLIGGEIGGIGYVTTVEEYDPVNDSWLTKGSSFPTGRECLTSSVVNGKIYVIGGYNGVPLSTVEEYDPTTDNWKTKSPMATPRCHATSSAVDGIIYVFGGYPGSGSTKYDSVEAYNPITDTWVTKTPMPEGRSGLASLGVDGKIYIFGGEPFPDENSSSVEEYNPAID